VEAERENHRRDAASRGLSRREQLLYAEGRVPDLPDFTDWLQQYTTQLVAARSSSNVDIDLLRLSSLPSSMAQSYSQMWAYGNHYRVQHDGEEHAFVTQDYGIASIFGAEEGQSVGVSMVGVLKEIIVVRYSAQRRVVFRGSWIRNDPGPRPSTKLDQYGFTVVRFNDRIPRGREPYILPATVRQVRQLMPTFSLLSGYGSDGCNVLQNMSGRDITLMICPDFHGMMAISENGAGVFHSRLVASWVVRGCPKRAAFAKGA
jgi:hypothetical protein